MLLIHSGGKLILLIIVNEVLWGVTNDGEIRYKANLLASWQIVPGLLKQVVVGKMGVFGVNEHDDIFYRVGTNENPAEMGTTWQQLPGLLVQISVGTHNVWGVNKYNNIWKMENIRFQNSRILFEYQQIDGALTHISAISSMDDTDVTTTSVTTTAVTLTTSTTNQGKKLDVI